MTEQRTDRETLLAALEEWRSGEEAVVNIGSVPVDTYVRVPVRDTSGIIVVRRIVLARQATLGGVITNGEDGDQTEFMVDHPCLIIKTSVPVTV